VFKLRNVVFAVAAFSLEDREHAAVLTASVRRVQARQVAIHRAPDNNRLPGKHLRLKIFAFLGVQFLKSFL